MGLADQAVPYLNAFLKSNPPDDVLLQIRDRYGAGSMLRLQDNPATREAAAPLLRLMADAALRQARNPERIRRFVDALTRSREEQDYALEQLRMAGSYAVPYLVEKLSQQALSAEDQALIAQNMGRLNRSAVPALIAVLDAPDVILAADAADALGRIGDPRAIAPLTYPAARSEESVLTEPARRAIARLTGRSYTSQAWSPVRLLTFEARKYLTHAVEFPTDTVEIWTWEGTAPAPRTVSRGEAEGILGLRFAREALTLDPTSHPAQVALVSLALQKAAERTGLGGFPAQDTTGAYPAALAAGPAVLGDVLRGALADGLYDLAAVAAFVLGQVADRDALTVDGPSHPLVEALAAPDRRVRFAAARSLVVMAPGAPFPGSSRVVPVLAQFAANRSMPRAVVIDGDENRANEVASAVRSLGYETQTAPSGREGFQLAVDAADLEVIFLSPAVLQGPWRTSDTLRNLRADARTAGVPIIFYGGLNERERLTTPLGAYSRVAFLVLPTAPQILGNQLPRELERMGVRPLSDEERQSLALYATGLLATIAERPGSPFNPDLAHVEPTLASALLQPQTAPAAALALADVPNVDAQRSLADTVLDPGKPAGLRVAVAGSLARSIQRFGPLVSASQERNLAQALADEQEPQLRTALSTIVGALRPTPPAIGRRLQSYQMPLPPVMPTPNVPAAPDAGLPQPPESNP